jgi:hypothetical protein
MRWATFDLGAFTNFKNVQLTFNNSYGFVSDPLGGNITNMEIYVRVNGSIPTNGWVDGNKAYSGIGDPTNNGDPALAVDTNAPVNVRKVTFGTQIKTGNVIVRIGIPAGDAKKFGSVTPTIV